MEKNLRFINCSVLPFASTYYRLENEFKTVDSWGNIVKDDDHYYANIVPIKDALKFYKILCFEKYIKSFEIQTECFRTIRFKTYSDNMYLISYFQDRIYVHVTKKNTPCARFYFPLRSFSRMFNKVFFMAEEKTSEELKTFMNKYHSRSHYYRGK